MVTTHHRRRLGFLTAEEFLVLVPDSTLSQHHQHRYQFNFGGKSYVVNMASKRYKVFRKSLHCAACGIKGEFVALERQMNTKSKKVHFNLYTKTGVMMTKDHIVPSSKGGSDGLNNLQTMCAKCNCTKGNRLITNEELKQEVLKNTG